MGRFGLCFLAVIWLVAVALGFHWILQYSGKPGESKEVPEEWPAMSALQPADHSYTLVMFLHPKCACSRASVHELDRVLAKAHSPLHAYLVFLHPEGFSEDWTKTDLWKSASLIPGVEMVMDQNGKEAELFSATTSGQTLLYGPDRHLQFSGGITMARGHEGDNSGETALLSSLGGRKDIHHTPVFGCSLSSHTRSKT